MLERGVTPVIPAQGSVGASGDLAPLAHMTAVLIGEGDAEYEGKVMPGTDALAAAGLAPIEIGPKEGIAFTNGTQFSTAFALAGSIRGLAMRAIGAGYFGAVHGCDHGLHRAFATRHSRAARPSRPDRGGLGNGRCSGGIANSRKPPLRRYPGSRPLLHSLSAASDGGRDRRAATGRGDAADRGECGHGQPARAYRRRQNCLRREFPCRAGRLRCRYDCAGDQRDWPQLPSAAWR